MKYDIKNPTIWFFTTVNEVSPSNGTPRLKMLPNQYVPSETDATVFVKCDASLNVESDLKPRKANPIGTIFAAKYVSTKSTKTGTKYYTVMRTKEEPNNLISMAGGVSSDIKDAYAGYLEQVTEVLSEEELLKKEPPKVDASGLTLIEKLKKEFPLPSVGSENFYVSPDVWEALLINMAKGYNTMLVGESGTGKTELSILLGEIMKKKVKVFDMAAKQDPIASLIGVQRFGDGKSYFDRADFTYAIEEDGIIVLDELPRAPVNTNNILFPLLDTRRELTMDVAASGMRSIKVHEECRFIATANEGYEYTGNTVLDKALKERFKLIPVDFMPEKEEISLLHKRTGLGKAMATVIVKAGRAIRELRKQDEITASISIRHTLYAADLASAGMTPSRAMEIAYLPIFAIEDDLTKVKDVLSSR